MSLIAGSMILLDELVVGKPGVVEAEELPSPTEEAERTAETADVVLEVNKAEVLCNES